MLILKPYPHITIWGGERLGKYIHQKASHLGHLYMVRGNYKDANVILNGDEQGDDLYHYFIRNRGRWKLERYTEFPISVALVDASENLSIQVHPDEMTAFKFEGVKKGKNESFYLLDEPETGQMINGCKCRSKEELRKRVISQDWDGIIDHLQVQKGNYVYVPAGTLHAMTKGALAYEIEETCDYTYRLYDYGRVDQNGSKRQLDTEKALESIDVAKKSDPRCYGNDEIVESGYATKLLCDEKGYINQTSDIVCLTIIEGSGIADGVKINDAMSIVLEPGDVIRDINIQRGIAARIL